MTELLNLLYISTKNQSYFNIYKDSLLNHSTDIKLSVIFFVIA